MPTDEIGARAINKQSLRDVPEMLCFFQSVVLITISPANPPTPPLLFEHLAREPLAEGPALAGVLPLHVPADCDALPPRIPCVRTYRLEVLLLLLADEFGHSVRQRFRVVTRPRRLESAHTRSHHEVLLPRALGTGVRFRLEVGPCHRLGQILPDVHALDAWDRRVLNTYWIEFRR